MEQVEVERQISLTIDDDEITDSGSVSDETSPPHEPFGCFVKDGMVQVEEGSSEHDIIKNCFLSGMEPFGKYTNVVAIHRNSSSCGLTRKARLGSFRLFSGAVAEKCGGNANLRYGWYGGTRDEVLGIAKYGFSHCGSPANGMSYGVGVQLSSSKFAIDSALASEVDEDGLRHILLCRVILGNMEVVCPGSKQYHPSSQQFDSGVDNLVAPRRYTVWSAYMNSHIFPSFIISFKEPCLKDFESLQANALKPTTPWMSFPALISILSRFLAPSKMAVINKCYKDFRGRKIRRADFIQRLRVTTGDSLLATIIKNYRKGL